MRRSTRARVPNKKYSVNAFADLELDAIISSDNSPRSQLAPETPLPIDDSGDDEEFDLAAAEAAEPREEEEDEESLAGNNSEGSSIATPQGGNSDLEVQGEDIAPRAVIRSARRPPGRRHTKPSPLLHFRGLRELNRKEGKPQKIMAFVGSDPKDVVPFLQARDKWVFGNILPTRKADRAGVGGMAHAPVHSFKKRKEEADAGWDWYYDEGGREMFCEGQKVRILNGTDAQPYRFDVTKRPSYKILLGPYGLQEPYELAHEQCLNIENIERPRGEFSDEKAAWLLNISIPVTSLEWAPNQSGENQYLAISTAEKTPLDPSLPSAFAPTRSSASTIQIWKFSALLDGDGDGRLNPLIQPELVHVICTEWGQVKHFKWCQVPRDFRQAGLEISRPIGLLAIIFGDGLVRVLDIQIHDLEKNSSPYVEYTTAAFATRPPNAICTCVTWLSSTEIAVGCANGFVAIFDIAEHLLPLSDSGFEIDEPPSSPTSRWPTPYFYYSLHTSYILAISSTYPTSSNFIATTSIDGNTRLTDIRAPYVDFVHTHRARIGQFSLAYQTSTQSFLTCDDQDYTRMLHIRSFYSISYVARSEGQVTCLAASQCHATVLTGSADGGVILTNPMPKMFYSKERQRQVLWFKHEWAAGKREPVSASSDAAVATQANETEVAKTAQATGTVEVPIQRPNPGMSRFTTSYLPTSYTHSGSMINNPMRPRGPGLGGGRNHPSNNGQLPSTRAGYTTVFEEQAGVTAVCWNPNVHVGGWAAAGLGSGLVRVEDLAADR